APLPTLRHALSCVGWVKAQARTHPNPRNPLRAFAHATNPSPPDLARVARLRAAEEAAIDGIGDIDAPAASHRTGQPHALDRRALTQRPRLRTEAADQRIAERHAAVARERDRNRGVDRVRRTGDIGDGPAGDIGIYKHAALQIDVLGIDDAREERSVGFTRA